MATPILVPRSYLYTENYLQKIAIQLSQLNQVIHYFFYKHSGFLWVSFSMLMIFLISALFHAYSMIKVIEFNTLEEIIFEGIKLGDSRNY